MEIKIIEASTKKKIDAVIEIAEFKDMPKKKDGWNFNWRSLFKTEGAEFYKLTINEQEKTIEGVIMLSLMNDEMMYMNNVEIAPHNYGSKGKYENITGCLIAFACLKGIEKGKNFYEGYLTFESKTALIDFYRNKYGATLARGQRMFIEPNVGQKLIKEYLDFEI